ncbi:hypothetical protein [Streptomyces sp. NBC_01304]|uniref:hypothetical protein n=1 Tax=Streptomyces sp. NBC_01304 TaxID=2903818 RepID=UPI002E149E5E|nr:hypothetical protein OG430_36315 [Streptomyces sp. NBC_01304]
MHMKTRERRTGLGLDRRAFSSLLAAGALTTLPACTRDNSAHVPPRPAKDLTVMVIRHAEKPDPTHPGIDERLRPDPKSLTARGWDRARKLPGLFNTTGKQGPGLPAPAAIFAAAATGPQGGARRHRQTVEPLAEQLGVEVDTRYARSQERELARAVVDGGASPVLVCWQHKSIPAVVRALGAAEAAGVPRKWPKGRFDLVWVFEYGVAEKAWAFRAVDQGLLEGDE